MINIYAPNTGALIYKKQNLTELKGEINSNTIILGDLNTTLSTMNRSYRQRLNEETSDFNYIIAQMNLTDI